MKEVIHDLRSLLPGARVLVRMGSRDREAVILENPSTADPRDSNTYIRVRFSDESEMDVEPEMLVRRL